jgi:alpha 1,3-glucosidase
MLQDPFTLTIALNKEGSAAGELYLDRGDGYEHRTGAFVWRAFEATTSTIGKEVKISSRDLAAKDIGAAVEVAEDGKGLEKYDPIGNAYAKEAREITVEKVVVLGLDKEPKTVKLESGEVLEFEFVKGTAAKGSAVGGASKLVIKRPAVGVVEDWTIVIA